jgi:hypothetical protein
MSGLPHPRLLVPIAGRHIVGDRERKFEASTPPKQTETVVSPSFSAIDEAKIPIGETAEGCTGSR